MVMRLSAPAVVEQQFPMMVSNSTSNSSRRRPGGPHVDEERKSFKGRSVETPTSYLKDKRPPKSGQLTWRHFQAQASSTSSVYQRRAKWLMGSVCAFVTLQFLWTMAMYMILSQSVDSSMMGGTTATAKTHDHMAYFVPKEGYKFDVIDQRTATIDRKDTKEVNVGVKGSMREQLVSYYQNRLHSSEPWEVVGMSSLRGSSNSNSDSGDDPGDDIGADTQDKNYYRYSIVFGGIQEPPGRSMTGRDIREPVPLRRQPNELFVPSFPDYGGLDFFIPLESGTARGIREDVNDEQEQGYDQLVHPDRQLADMFLVQGSDGTQGETADDNEEDEDEMEDEYYAFDDDAVRAVATAFDEHNHLDVEHYSTCRRTHIHRLSFPTCNEFHQLDYVASPTETKFRFLNNGAFRQVFGYRSTIDLEEQVAMKEIVYEDIDDDPLIQTFEYVRMDAIVAEQLTASPRIYDIYGYCGLSILSEFFPHGDLEELSSGPHGHIRPKNLHDEFHVRPQNDLTPRQKLLLALDMAEGLADLHGYKESLIIHDDVQLSQFLLNADATKLKLNDFNRAEFALWDNTRQTYCRYQNGKGHGNWRSPEEYKDEPLTEAIDVWSYGNNLYTLLTGLDPFYELDNVTGKQVRKTKPSVIKGETAYVDPRYAENSPEERVLVKLIHQCYEYHAEERITIFDIVKELRKAVEELTKHEGNVRTQQHSLFRGLPSETR